MADRRLPRLNSVYGSILEYDCIRFWGGVCVNLCPQPTFSGVLKTKWWICPRISVLLWTLQSSGSASRWHHKNALSTACILRWMMQRLAEWSGYVARKVQLRPVPWDVVTVVAFILLWTSQRLTPWLNISSGNCQVIRLTIFACEHSNGMNGIIPGRAGLHQLRLCRRQTLLITSIAAHCWLMVHASSIPCARWSVEPILFLHIPSYATP